MISTTKLKNWWPQLEDLSEDFQGILASWLPKLNKLVEIKQKRKQGQDNFEGYEGIHRTGHYNRLLINEWALLTEEPDEFLRRAAMSEHLFLAPAQVSPQGHEELVLLFDAGPQQLGQPRIAQIALLILLFSKIADSGTTLKWGILQQLHTEEPLHLIQQKISLNDIRTFINSRSNLSMSEETLCNSSIDMNNIWLIGGETCLEVGQKHAIKTISIVEPWQNPGYLEVQIHEPQKRNILHTLELFPEALAAQVLRHPFKYQSNHISTLNTKRNPSFEGQRTFVFGRRNTRLSVKLKDRSVCSYHIPVSTTDPLGKDKFYTPSPGYEFLGSTWTNKRAILLSRKRQQLRLIGLHHDTQVEIGIPEEFTLPDANIFLRLHHQLQTLTFDNDIELQSDDICFEFEGIIYRIREDKIHRICTGYIHWSTKVALFIIPDQKELKFYSSESKKLFNTHSSSTTKILSFYEYDWTVALQEQQNHEWTICTENKKFTLNIPKHKSAVQILGFRPGEDTYSFYGHLDNSLLQTHQGKWMVIKVFSENIKEAFMPSDGNHILVCLQSGSLEVFDTKYQATLRVLAT